MRWNIMNRRGQRYHCHELNRRDHGHELNGRDHRYYVGHELNGRDHRDYLGHELNRRDHRVYFAHELNGYRYSNRYSSYHDNPLRFGNDYLDRSYGPCGYEDRRMYRHHTNQQSLMYSDDYKDPPCCSVIQPCEKNYPVGSSLYNPEKWICFLNCILQCVVHTVPLVSKLLSDHHQGPCPSGSDEFCCYCSLRFHAAEVIVHSGDVLYPRKFVKLLNLIFPDSVSGRHEDAHEFLRCLLDKLDEVSSIVKEIFGGQLKSQLYCPECNHCSDRLEPFLDLNLEVNQMESVIDALKSFTKIEVVENFICDGCKSRVNMEKHFKVEQAPEVLVIQLKRFQNLESCTSKIEDMVNYQLELDLKPFMSSPDDKPQNYDLYGVVEHLGTPSKGHYVCFIRSSQKDWFFFNDDKVVKWSEDGVLDNKAYLLFYVKQGSCRWFSTLLKKKDILPLDHLKEVEERFNKEIDSSDSDGSNHGGSDSYEQDTTRHCFGSPAEKNEAGPSSAGLTQQENDNGSILWNAPDQNEVSCSLGGSPSEETDNPHPPSRSRAINGYVGGLALLLENKENVSPQGSHDIKELSHSIHGSSSQANDAGSHGGSPQEIESSCSLLQSSSQKQEYDCPPESSSFRKDDEMSSCCDSPAGPLCACRRMGISRSRTVGSNSDNITKDGGYASRARKRMKLRSAGARNVKQKKKDVSLRKLLVRKSATWASRGRYRRRRR
ncbi:hypothetical protein BRADI_3g34176v3 [Brachypodium distachyon]|uniref:USP domain-containing protein n=1 Tax=Brachypodium distachyon TaxID=15368 RepID=A0A2K2D108_BRADI|nr:hypothetical protein BRADI_3g34176v3 [Brachypodium distachyon]